jgi:hypothetical protein
MEARAETETERSKFANARELLQASRDEMEAARAEYLKTRAALLLARQMPPQKFAI